ncbi:MAG: hypothetical protein LUB60_04850 [Clostridiales bacterium]|nr:hypothetical protein [Clostridiales bacterium]
MKKIIQSYRAFAPKGYRIVALMVLPLAILALRVFLTGLTSDPDDYIYLLSLDYISIILLELIADHWLFGGICGKDSPRIEYLRTSARGEESIRRALTGDLLRRFVWLSVYACVIFALTGQIRIFLSILSVYTIVTAMLNINRYFQTAVYRQLFASVVIIFYSMFEIGISVSGYTNDGYAPVPLWKLPVMAAIAVIVSILTLRHMMFHVRENRFDQKLSAADCILRRKRKELS